MYFSSFGHFRDFVNLSHQNLGVTKLWFFFREAQADLEFGIRSGLVPIGIMCAKIVETKNFDVVIEFLLDFSAIHGFKTDTFPFFHHFSPAQHQITS